VTQLVLDDTFAISRLGPAAAIPAWASAGDFFSIKQLQTFDVSELSSEPSRRNSCPRRCSTD
jgi:hypothetical protein